VIIIAAIGVNTGVGGSWDPQYFWMGSWGLYGILL